MYQRQSLPSNDVVREGIDDVREVINVDVEMARDMRYFLFIALLIYCLFCGFFVIFLIIEIDRYLHLQYYHILWILWIIRHFLSNRN